MLSFDYNFSTTNEDILRDWAEIRNTANEILGDTTTSPVRAKVPLAGNAETNGRSTDFIQTISCNF